MGYHDHTVTDGRIVFPGDAAAICRANLWLRSADRVLWQIGQFSANDFGELFEGVKALPWSDILPRGAAFPVRARSVRSQLHHTPSIQSIVKKAIVEAVRPPGHTGVVQETGPEFAVDVVILKDQVSISLDTSGDGLHKRGYRKSIGSSPLKETLAAALVQLSFWQWGRPFHDPCCGSGTIPIEAALWGLNMAPGRLRNFAAEAWPITPGALWEQARAEAEDVMIRDPQMDGRMLGTDIDRRALGMARQHAELAGVSEFIHFQDQAVADMKSSRDYGCLIMNPPYGERVGTDEELRAVYGELPRLMTELDTWSFYLITAYPEYSRVVTRKPDRRRKLYNGRIECTYYQYFGPRPPR